MKAKLKELGSGATWVAVVTALLGFCAGVLTYQNRNRELDIEMVKVGIGILRADPKETQTEGARAWALRTIERFSTVEFSEEERAELLKGKLGYVNSFYGVGATATYGGYRDTNSGWSDDAGSTQTRRDNYGSSRTGHDNAGSTRTQRDNYGSTQRK